MLRGILAVAMAAAVIAAEKTPAVLHATDRTRIVTGVLFAVPFLLVIWLLGRLAKARAAASAPRRGRQFASYQNRRR